MTLATRIDKLGTETAFAVSLAGCNARAGGGDPARSSRKMFISRHLPDWNRQNTPPLTAMMYIVAPTHAPTAPMPAGHASNAANGRNPR